MSPVETGQMSAVETGQMSAAETGQMSAVETKQMLKSQIRSRAQNQETGPKWVENGRQASRIHQNGSHSLWDRSRGLWDRSRGHKSSKKFTFYGGGPSYLAHPHVERVGPGAP